MTIRELGALSRARPLERGDSRSPQHIVAHELITHRPTEGALEPRHAAHSAYLCGEIRRAADRNDVPWMFASLVEAVLTRRLYPLLLAPTVGVPLALVTDQYSNPLIHIAVAIGCPEMLTIIASTIAQQAHECKVTMQPPNLASLVDSHGRSALVFTIERNDAVAMQILLERRASLYRMYSGETPLEMSRRLGHFDAERVLLAHKNAQRGREMTIEKRRRVARERYHARKGAKRARVVHDSEAAEPAAMSL